MQDKLIEKNYHNEIDIAFNSPRTFLGRNGWYKATGIHIQSNIMTTKIEPITSKGKIASCTIEIPTEDLDRFIESLKKVKKSKNNIAT